MDRVLIVIKKVCYSILIFLSIVFFLIIVTLLSAKVLAGADTIVDTQTGSNEREVTLYYGNEEYLLTGNPEVPRLIKLKKVVTAGEKGLEETIIRELLKSPGDGMVSLIPPDAVLLDARRESSKVVVNFSSENMHGGSLQEAVALDQILHSLADSCGIDEVLILLDGKTAETLMGHLDISVPIRVTDHIIK